MIGDSDQQPDNMDNHIDRPEIRAAVDGMKGVSVRYSKTLNTEMMYVAIPLLPGKKISAVLRTSMAMTEINDKFSGLIRELAAGCLLIVLFAAFISLLQSRRMARPVEEIKQGMERFGRGNLDDKLGSSDIEEINVLAETMNQMAARLREQIDMIYRRNSELEAVLSCMKEGVIALDTDERIIRFNPSACVMLDKKPEELNQRILQESIRNPEFHKIVHTGLRTRQPLSNHIAYFQNDDRILEIHSVPLNDGNDETIGILIVMNDVTRMKVLETIRRDFTVNISHEIRTPLTVINGYIETLLQQEPICQNGEVNRMLRIIEKHVKRLVDLSQSLNSLSDIEQNSDQNEIAMKNINISGILKKAVAFCSEAAENKNINIEINGDESLEIRANELLLERAIGNMVENAVQFTPAGEIVQIQFEKMETDLAVRFADKGPGIPKHHHDRLFERFYRVDSSRNRRYGGAGLGLAVVRHIIDIHGGRIAVDSRPGKGSVFTLYLPIKGV